MRSSNVQPSAERLVIVRDVALQLNVSPACIYALAKKGLLIGHKIGVGRGTWRFRPEDVDAYLASAKQGSQTLPTLRREPKASSFKHLDGERLRAAWQRQGVAADPKGGRSARSS